MTSDRFTAPAAAGDLLPAKDIINHLVLVAPHEYRTGIVTRFNKPDNPTSDAIVVDVAVLTQQDAAGQVPVFRDVLWFNVGLRLTLKKQMGQFVLARMGQGEARQGQDPPFQLINATDDSQAVAFADAWMNQHPEFEQEAARKHAEANGGTKVVSVAQVPPAPAAVPSVPTLPAAPPVNAAPSLPTAAVSPAPPAANLPAPPTNGAFTIDPAVLAALPADQQEQIRKLMGATQ